MITRKAKPWNKIVDDPNLLFSVGQLVGAANVAAHLLLNQEKPDVKVIGEHLQKQVAWFYEDVPRGG